MGLQSDGSWVEGRSVEGRPLTATPEQHLMNHCWDEWAYRQHASGMAISRSRWLKDWPQTRRYRQVVEQLARAAAKPE